MADQLRAWTGLSEDLNLIPDITLTSHNHVQLQLQGVHHLLPLRAPHPCVPPPIRIHTIFKSLKSDSAAVKWQSLLYIKFAPSVTERKQTDLHTQHIGCFHESLRLSSRLRRRRHYKRAAGYQPKPGWMDPPLW